MNPDNEYRDLTGNEIKELIANGCSCENWKYIKVKDGFATSSCKNVIFSGEIRLGIYNKPIVDESGISQNCGISNTQLHNCTIGSNVLISNTGEYIANYHIEDDVIIRNCGKISTDGVSTFGNGTEVAVLSETGGRSVKIWDRLSAHEAYVIALYRHRSKTIKIIERMVDDYASSLASCYGRIGHSSKIINCNTIRNIRIAPYSKIEGAIRLNEGSVNSCKEDPVYIGPGVIMEHFIICSGSTVTESTLIDKCFIGQGCVLAKHYSAENSLFFTNCGGYHGEACSIFAGPYTVTHHKSTLLIAGIFSFMNAGSGSNQSNHMYKLGPIHQGIMERGSKTTSDSYLMWPARIGPFTLIMGRHYKNVDTSSLPFSYLLESNDESILVPGINLRSVGTMRDAQKWPGRDHRKDPYKIDQVNFNVLSPYTIRKMFEGRDLLLKLRTISGDASAEYSYNNMIIKGSALDKGMKLYQTGINKFLGNSLIRRLEKTKFNTSNELQNQLMPDQPMGKGVWVDIAGLIAPQKAVDKLLDEIEAGRINSVEMIAESFREMHKMYSTWEWTWTADLIEAEEGKKIEELTADDIIRIVEKWKKSVTDLDKQLYEDARKEFALSSMTGFGIDGGDEVKKLDFEQVRGEFESNSVVAAIQEHIKKNIALADELIERMRKIK